MDWLLTVFCKENLRPMLADDGGDDGDDTYDNPLLWTRTLRHHSLGEFSVAVVQANRLLEDQVQVDVCRQGMFVGVYDGHAGNVCSRYVADRLLPNLLRTAKGKPNVSIGEAVHVAFLLTDEEFMTSVVDKRLRTSPNVASTGTCCLVGILWGRTLWVANAGDSRAVLGRVGNSGAIVAEQLSEEHNAGIKSVRRSLIAQHPDDLNIVIFIGDAWRVKGITQYTRAIGDARLKRPDIVVPARVFPPRPQVPLKRAVLTAEPSIKEHPIQPEDRFLIFASRGLWYYLTNEEAVEIVAHNPRQGIATKLVRAAIEAVVTSTGQTYEFIKKINKGERCNYHDDISVVVVYIDQDIVGESPNLLRESTVRPFTVETSSVLALLDEVRR